MALKINVCTLVLLSMQMVVMAESEFEKVATIIQKFIPNNPTIIEAGAHIGNDARAMSSFWPQGRIYSFEPVSALFERLKVNTAHCANVRTFKLALSDKNEDKTIYVSRGRGDGSSSLCVPKDHLKHFSDVTFNTSENIRTIVLDDWIKSEKIGQVDLLWLDLQGMEYQALNASPELLQSVTAIYAEVNLVELYEGGWLYPQFRDWLESKGFVEVYKMLIHNTFGDALFVKKEVADKCLQ